MLVSSLSINQERPAIFIVSNEGIKKAWMFFVLAQDAKHESLKPDRCKTKWEDLGIWIRIFTQTKKKCGQINQPSE